MIPDEPSTKLSPFSCTYSSQIPELLLQLNCSIAISTYQAGKLIFISPKDENSLIQLPRHFEKIMGIAEDVETDKIALALKDNIVVFSNSKDLATHYPKAKNIYDSLYLPRVTYHTGRVDLHDLSFGKDKTLFAVNTLFSCIVKIDDNYSFTPFWTPPFVDSLVSEDRCHLNGMALKNGLPKYVTAFNTGNTFQSWRNNITKTGVVIDVETNKIIADGLAMPHSPLLVGDDLYVLLSATGELLKINTITKKTEVIIKIKGFVRGMSLHKDYLFIGLSKLRKNSSTFGMLDFAKEACYAGIKVIHLPTKSIVGEIKYQTSVDEIFDVHILSGKLRPNILNTKTNDYKFGLTIPGTSFWAKSSDEK